MKCVFLYIHVCVYVNIYVYIHSPNKLMFDFWVYMFRAHTYFDQPQSRWERY